MNQGVNIKKLAMLSRLKFTEEEEGAFAAKLESVVGFVNKISEVDTSGAPPMSSTIEGASTPERPDVVTEPNLRDQFQRIAPKAEMGFYVVPKIVE